MKGAIKFRLVTFAIAIAGMIGLITWTAYSSWQRTGELREKLTAVQLQSFRIADHLQHDISDLNNFVLRYGVYHETKDWLSFSSASKALDKWLDSQKPVTQREQAILNLINTNYDFYMLAAK